MCGNSAYCWNTVFTSRLYGGTLLTSRPASDTMPAVGRSKPAITRSVVVFPLPLGPRIEKNSLSPTEKLTSSTAGGSPVV